VRLLAIGREPARLPHVARERRFRRSAQKALGFLPRLRGPPQLAERRHTLGGALLREDAGGEGSRMLVEQGECPVRITAAQRLVGPAQEARFVGDGPRWRLCECRRGRG